MWGSSPEEEDTGPELAAELRRWSRGRTCWPALLECAGCRLEGVPDLRVSPPPHSTPGA